MTVAGIICTRCGQPAPKRGTGHQKYCEPCSDIRNHERQTTWAKNHPPSREKQRRWAHMAKSRARMQGEATSAREAMPVTWLDTASPDLEWIVRVSLPFQWAVSKNHIYTMRRSGHVALRRETKTYRSAIVDALQKALDGRKVAINKVWLDILVQKPNHKGDAVNVVDAICDAIKLAINVDDRWFSIRRLDWQIVKRDPRIYIGIGQETVEDARICSCCGRILPLTAFQKHASNLLGVGRECRECKSIRREAA